MCKIWLKSVHRRLLHAYVKYNDFVTFLLFTRYVANVAKRST